jgi:hypothetical protein
MPGRRRALDAIADLLGLPPVAVRAVERRTNGDYAIVLRQPRPGSYAAQAMPRWTWSRRALRIPRTRVEGYWQRSPWARERDVRARRRANAKRFALWLLWRLDPAAPVVERAIRGGDLEAVDELRPAILGAAGVLEPAPVGIVFVFAVNGRQAAA